LGGKGLCAIHQARPPSNRPIRRTQDHCLIDPIILNIADAHQNLVKV